MKSIIFSGILILLIVYCVSSASIGKSSTKDENPDIQGLYSNDDKVLILKKSNFEDRLFDKKHATLVKFYVTWCGHCIGYAPIWKKFARINQKWRETVQVAVLNCYDQKNVGICRDYNITTFPSIRYFPPHFKGENVGERFVHHKDVELLRIQAIETLENEKNPDSEWPDLKKYSDKLDDLPINKNKFTFIISEPEKSIEAASTILDLHSQIQDSSIYRIDSDESFSNVMVLDANHNVINESLTEDVTRASMSYGIENFLKSQEIQLKELKPIPGVVEIPPPKYTKEAIDKIKSLKNAGQIFVADLELALKTTLFLEVRARQYRANHSMALQGYLNATAKYFPFESNGKKFLSELRDYVISENDKLDPTAYEKQIELLREQNNLDFKYTNWIGCYSNSPKLRKYPCGMWTTFHYLTVQSAESKDQEEQQDPLEILGMVYNYMKNFFRCSSCAQHFLEMADRRKIWDVKTKDDAILWLWEAHNEVNERLSDDSSTDPEFPKIQFPSKETCNKCHMDNEDKESNEVKWNKPEVLNFLKKIYSRDNLNKLNLDSEIVKV